VHDLTRSQSRRQLSKEMNVIGLNFYGRNAAVQFPNQFVQQFSQTPADSACQYGPTILRTPREMIVDLIYRVSCSFAHNKPMIARVFYNVKLRTRKEESQGGRRRAPIPLPLKKGSSLDAILWTAEHGGRFVLAGGLTLADQQRDFFFNALAEQFPDLLERYQRLYPQELWPDAQQLERDGVAHQGIV
jgi:hypothetical protein